MNSWAEARRQSTGVDGDRVVDAKPAARFSDGSPGRPAQYSCLECVAVTSRAGRGGAPQKTRADRDSPVPAISRQYTFASGANEVARLAAC